jgi:hypothetical protein
MSEEITVKCVGCNNEVLESELQDAPDGEKYCEQCMDNSVTCHACGSFSLGDGEYSWIGDYPYCSNCHYNCEDCGEAIVEDDSWSFDGEDSIYCEDCYKKRETPYLHLLAPFTKEEGGNWYFKIPHGKEVGPFGTKEEALKSMEKQGKMPENDKIPIPIRYI